MNILFVAKSTYFFSLNECNEILEDSGIQQPKTETIGNADDSEFGCEAKIEIPDILCQPVGCGDNSN